SPPRSAPHALSLHDALPISLAAPRPGQFHLDIGRATAQQRVAQPGAMQARGAARVELLELLAEAVVQAGVAEAAAQPAGAQRQGVAGAGVLEFLAAHEGGPELVAVAAGVAQGKPGN